MTSVGSCFGRCLNWLRRRTCLTVAAFCALTLLLFVVFSVVNWAGEAHHFDRDIIIALRAPGGQAMPLGGLGFQALCLVLTRLADHAVLAAIIFAASIYLLMSERLALALLLAGAAASGAALIYILKIVFARRADDILNNSTYHVLEVWADSFPSGHATLAAVVYLTLGGLLASQQKTQGWKICFIALALTLTMIVGATRVYLGIHYPTDVFGGWSIGAALALGAIVLASRMRKADEMRDE